MKEKSMCRKYTDKEITWTEYNNWVILKNSKNIKSMHRRYIDKKITATEYLDWLAQNRGFKDNKDIVAKLYPPSKESVIKRTKLYRQRNREKIIKRKKQWYSENKDKARQYERTHKEQISNRYKQWLQKNPNHKKEYYHTVNGKIATNKCISKREKEFGYNVLNISDVSNPLYVGHHLDKENVLFIPEKLHKSIWHRQSDKVLMNKINTAAITWYLNHIGFVIN